jgi:Ca-activated chloride channel family protein
MKYFASSLLLTAALAVPAIPVFAAANRPVEAANSQYREGNYAEALKTYTELAEERPDSPEIQFNRGTAQFQLGDLDAARAAFEEASLLSDDPALQALCSYNLGNCSVAEAGTKGPEDPKAALASLSESLRYYKDALARNNKLGEAAHNLETAKRAIQQIREQMQQQQQEQQHQQNEMKEKLDELIEEQSKQNDQSSQAAQQQEDPGQPDPSKQQLDNLAQQQADTQQKTEELTDSMEASSGGESSPMKEAQEHAEQAAQKQQEAADHLKNQEAGKASAAQEEALDELKQARDKLADPPKDEQEQSRQQSGDGQEGNEQEGESKPNPAPEKPDEGENAQSPPPQQPQEELANVPPPDATARDILNQEQRNKELRNVQKMIGIRPVEKDW